MSLQDLIMLNQKCEELETEIEKLKADLKREQDENASNVKLIAELAQVRVYNSANVFRGVMIRDNAKAYELVKLARITQQQRREGGK